MNSAIVRLIIGKTEEDAIQFLKQYNCHWRIFSRDGNNTSAAMDRDDGRYNLVLRSGKVERVLPG